MSNADSDGTTEATEAWWNTLQAEVCALTLATAGEAVENTFHNWQQVQKQAQKHLVQEWKLQPGPAPMLSNQEFVSALNHEISQRADVQEAWQCFVEAMQARQRAFTAWVAETSADTYVLGVGDRALERARSESTPA